MTRTIKWGHNEADRDIRAKNNQDLQDRNNALLARIDAAIAKEVEKNMARLSTP